MTINLQNLKSTFSLDTNPLQAGAKLAIAGVGAVIAAVGIAGKATLDWAADLDSLGDVADGAGDSLAGMAFIARKSGVGVDAVAKATFNLNKGLLRADGTLDTVGKSLKAYGIAVKDANGNVKDSVQLTDEIAKKYASLSTQQERVNFLTEVYGKAGKDMIDFFDTLVAGGGLDKVTKKVKDLGLAIDPARYEQFNRNLEEMKLMGLGVAVGFTEKLMPAVEKFTDWMMNKGIPNFIDFKKGFERAFNRDGVAGALKFLDEELSRGLDSIDWSGFGAKFGDLIENALTNGSGEIDVPKSLSSLGNGIKEFFISAIGRENLDAFKNHFVDYILLQLGILDTRGTAIFKHMLDTMSAISKMKLSEIGNTFLTWATTNPREAFTVFNTVASGAMPQVMNNLGMILENKLREIAKKFYTRAAGWVQQAVQGFTGQLPQLLSVVSGLVASINAELRRIVTSFRITISTIFGGGGSSSTGTTGNHDTGSDNPSRPGRATGGPTLAGQSYNVVELNKPEVFTPNTSGRIDPLRNSNEITLSRRSIEDLTDRLASKVPAAMVKAMNSA